MAIAVYTPTTPLSKPQPYQPTDPALISLVTRAVAAYPSEESRIRRGAEIVEKDGVQIREDGMYLVGIFHFYPVNGHCPCADRAPDGRCKHRYAKTFYRQLHAAPAPDVRTKTFVASLDDTCGILTASEDGRASFAPYDGTLPPWALSDYEIAYKMVLGKELCANA